MARHEHDLDNRHRDKDGQIGRKHGNTLVSTLRETYGKDFASGIRGDLKLSEVLRQLDKPSLSALVKDSELIVVRATWDPEARVYVAESDDVPGLVTEAGTIEALGHKLPGLIEDLLETEGAGREIEVRVRLPQAA
jgi:Domain of unknown function (DUF1902)